MWSITRGRELICSEEPGSKDEIANEPRNGLQQWVDFTVQWLENVIN